MWVKADDAQAGVAQQDARGESCDAASDNRDIVSFVAHASSLSQTRGCTGYTPPESLADRARHSAVEDLCPGVPSGSYT